jgi:hypothetical protein
MKKLTLSVVTLTMTVMSYGQTQCNGLTKDSIQCKNITKSKTELCYLHDKMYVKDDKVSQKCKGSTKKNKSCKNKTKNESGLCYRHEEN